MKNLSLLLFLYLGVFSAKCQVETTVPMDSSQQTPRVVFINRQHGVSLSYKGNPYLFTTFQRGTVSMVGGKTMEMPLLYNILTNEITVLNGEKTTALSNVNFTLGSHAFIPIRHEYYEVLFDGKVKLLKKYICVIKPLGRRGGLYVGGSGGYDGEIIKDVKYYVQLPTQKVKRLTNQKRTIAILSNDYPSIKDFLKDDATPVNEEALLQFFKEHS